MLFCVSVLRSCCALCFFFAFLECFVCCRTWDWSNFQIAKRTLLSTRLREAMRRRCRTWDSFLRLKRRRCRLLMHMRRMSERSFLCVYFFFAIPQSIHFIQFQRSGTLDFVHCMVFCALPHKPITLQMRFFFWLAPLFVFYNVGNFRMKRFSFLLSLLLLFVCTVADVIVPNSTLEKCTSKANNSLRVLFFCVAHFASSYVRRFV